MPEKKIAMPDAKKMDLKIKARELEEQAEKKAKERDEKKPVKSRSYSTKLTKL